MGSLSNVDLVQVQTRTQTCVYAPRFGGDPAAWHALRVSLSKMLHKGKHRLMATSLPWGKEICEDPLMAVHLGHRSWPGCPWISAFLLFSLLHVTMS